MKASACVLEDKIGWSGSNGVVDSSPLVEKVKLLRKMKFSRDNPQLSLWLRYRGCSMRTIQPDKFR